MSSTKTARLLLLINVLQSTSRPLTAEEIRQVVGGYAEGRESFQRAFERDKDALRTMGVPLDMSDVPGLAEPRVGYRILDRDLALADPDLDHDEREALHLAAAAVNAGEHGRLALMKLGAGVSGSDRAVEIPADAGVAMVFAAVIERRRLRFSYNRVDRTVLPYRMQFSRGRWYLIGFDEGRGEIRNYRIGRIEGSITTGDEPAAFDPPEEPVAGVTMSPWSLHEDPEPVEAEVWFDPAVRVAVRADLRGDGIVVRDDDDGLVVRLPVTYHEGFRSWILSYLDRAEVLGPPGLRAQMVDWLTKVANRG
ncbi:MAG: WYL domain-containing protein [Aquihabitans sp.]